MKRIRIIPILLFKNAGLYKTKQFKNPRYVGDPINAVRIFNDKEVDEIILLDIDATILNKEPNYEMIEEICSEAFMPFGYGGGLKNLDQIKKIFTLGVEKIIINTQAFYNPKLIVDVAKNFGTQSIVVSVDVKKNVFSKYNVYVKSGTVNTRLNPLQFAKSMESSGAGEIIINSIDKDGTFKGYDIDLIHKVSSSLKIPVIACGGASKIEDFKDAITRGNASAVAAGSFFVFQRPHKAVLISYPSSNELKEKLYTD